MLLSEKKNRRGGIKKMPNKVKYTRLIARTTWSLVADIDVFAQSIGRTRSDVVRWALRDYLDKNWKRAPEED